MGMSLTAFHLVKARYPMGRSGAKPWQAGQNAAATTCVVNLSPLFCALSRICRSTSMEPSGQYQPNVGGAIGLAVPRHDPTPMGLMGAAHANHKIHCALIE